MNVSYGTRAIPLKPKIKLDFLGQACYNRLE